MMRAMRNLLALLALTLSACSGASSSSDAPSDESAGDETSEIDVAATSVTSAADPSLLAPMQELLDAHNRRRAEHCAPPLAWSSELARHAQAWADSLRERGCAFEHSGGDYGENLAAGTSGTLGGEAVTEMWYGESARFDFRRGGFSMHTGHFTQLVWIASEHVGCGVTQCDGMDVWVCNYDPPGNVEGEYRENVRPTSCR